MNIKLLSLLLLLTLLCPVLTGAEFLLIVKEVKDGDTIVADIHVGLDDLIFQNQTIRFSDIDCWEVSKHRQSIVVTDAEILKGKKAKSILEELLSSSRTIAGETVTPQRDVYGRRLMKVKADSVSVADHLRKNNCERK